MFGGLESYYLPESDFLEVTNAAFFWLSVCAIIIFTRYIWVKLDHGYRFLQGAIALLALWYSLGLTRGPLWWARYLTNSGHPQQVPQLELALSAGVGVIAMLCIIRVFAEDPWRRKAWVISLLSTAGFCLASYMKWIPIIGY